MDFGFYLSFGFLNATQAADIVPCGKIDASGNITNPCTWCNLMQMISNIITFMLYIVFPIAATMIVVGGISIMTAAGSPQKIKKGKEIITAAIIGLLIALFSYFIIDTIIKVLAGQVTTGPGQIPTIKGLGPWNKLEC